IGSMCYLKCPKDYSRRGLSCVAPKGASYTPKTYTLFDKEMKVISKTSQEAICNSNRIKDMSMCYLKCSDKDPKWSNIPGAAYNCQGPRGLIYPTETATPKVNGKDSKPADCKSNRENDGGLCYKKCKDIFGDCYRTQPGAVTECMPKNGTSYNPNKAECPKGTVDNGAGMCANSYVPPTYAKKTITADCTGNRDQIAGSCYAKCPKIKDHDGVTDIQLKHLEGMPTQCVPSKGASYAGLVLSYIPDTYDRKRAIAYSKK
ncbi:MAG: hypothetical protein EBR91_11230, partial [Flavobacteriia bacterium]|nr:hypothetical protein [Flavobacteriia bacterium]